MALWNQSVAKGKLYLLTLKFHVRPSIVIHVSVLTVLSVIRRYVYLILL
jgi:hypothetical protein